MFPNFLEDFNSNDSGFEQFKIPSFYFIFLLFEQTAFVLHAYNFTRKITSDRHKFRNF